MQVTCEPQAVQPQRNYGVVYINESSGDGGGSSLTVCNKFASKKPSKYASVLTVFKYAVGLVRAAYFGWILKYVL